MIKPRKKANTEAFIINLKTYSLSQAIIDNTSEGGLGMKIPFIMFDVGEFIQIHHDLHILYGEVRWIGEGRFGVRLISGEELKNKLQEYL